MGTAVLRPNLHRTATGPGWLSTDPDSINSPDSDSDYLGVSVPDGFQTSSGIEFEFGTFTLPTLSQVRNVQARARFWGTPYLGNQYMSVGLGVPGGLLYVGNGVQYSESGLVTKSFVPAPNAPSGNPWTQEEIDSVYIWFMMGIVGWPPNHTTYEARVYEVYVDVTYNEVPVVDVTGPTTPVTNTTKPTVLWTYTDPESDVQERFRVKVFTASQYGSVGFDPETSTPTYDSGEIFSSSLQHVIPTDLLNNETYRAYVKAADVGSNGRYSLWDYIQFSITVSEPPAPFLIATTENSNATGPRTKLDITRTANATPTTYMTIEHSDDVGVTWKTLRGASNIVNSPDGTTFTIYDYEAPPQTIRAYRARAVRTV